MNKDNFVKNCHLLAKDAQLIEQDKNGELYIPLRFWSELSEVLVELGIQTIQTKGQYHVKKLERENERLKKELYLERSYRDEPAVPTIGDAHNMGAW